MQNTSVRFLNTREYINTFQYAKDYKYVYILTYIRRRSCCRLACGTYQMIYTFKYRANPGGMLVGSSKQQPKNSGRKLELILLVE